MFLPRPDGSLEVLQLRDLRLRDRPDHRHDRPRQRPGSLLHVELMPSDKTLHGTLPADVRERLALAQHTEDVVQVAARLVRVDPEELLRDDGLRDERRLLLDPIDDLEDAVTRGARGRLEHEGPIRPAVIVLHRVYALVCLLLEVLPRLNRERSVRRPPARSTNSSRVRRRMSSSCRCCLRLLASCRQTRAALPGRRLYPRVRRGSPCDGRP